jgi:hypothetical protein
VKDHEFAEHASMFHAERLGKGPAPPMRLMLVKRKRKQQKSPGQTYLPGCDPKAPSPTDEL